MKFFNSYPTPIGVCRISLRCFYYSAASLAGGNFRLDRRRLFSSAKATVCAYCCSLLHLLRCLTRRSVSVIRDCLAVIFIASYPYTCVYDSSFPALLSCDQSQDGCSGKRSDTMRSRMSRSASDGIRLPRSRDMTTRYPAPNAFFFAISISSWNKFRLLARIARLSSALAVLLNQLRAHWPTTPLWMDLNLTD